MMTMDSAARAIDAMLHRGRAEERDGGVWLDDLAAGEVAEVEGMTAPEWRDEAERWEQDCRTAGKYLDRIGDVLDAVTDIDEAKAKQLRPIVEAILDIISEWEME